MATVLRPRLRLLLVLAALGIALGGCGIFGPGPHAAAKQWMQAYAANDGNTLAELTCAADQSQLQQGMLFQTAATVLTGGLLGVKPQIDVAQLQFTTTSQSGSNASVHVTGQMHVAILGVSQAQNINTTMPMLYENGKWRFCQT